MATDVITDGKGTYLAIAEDGTPTPISKEQADLIVQQQAEEPGFGRMLGEAGATGLVGAGLTAAAAPLTALGPPGIAANRAIAGTGAGLTQGALSLQRGAGFRQAGEDALLAGTTEAVAPAAFKIAGKVGQKFGGPVVRGVKQLVGRGLNPAGTRFLSETGEMIAGAPTREAAGEVLQVAADDAVKASKAGYTATYNAFEEMGGVARVNVDDAVALAGKSLQKPSVGGSSPAKEVYDNFLKVIERQKAGELKPFTALELDNYLGTLKRGQRAATDGNAKLAYKELVSTLEGSLDKAFDPALAKGNPAAKAILDKARKQYTDHLAKYGSKSRIGKIATGTGEDAARLIDNPTTLEIKQLRSLLPEDQFAALRSQFLRDKILRLPPDELGGVESLETGLSTFNALQNKMKNPKLLGQFREYYGEDAVKWLKGLKWGRRGAALSQPAFVRTGELTVLLAAGYGVGSAVGSTGAGVLMVASPLLASQLITSAGGQKALTALGKASTSPATQRIMVQVLQREARKFGLEDHLRFESEEGG